MHMMLNNTLLLFVFFFFFLFQLSVQLSSSIILAADPIIPNDDAAAAAAASSSDDYDFIRSECRRATRYPELCIRSLYNYAPTIHLSSRQLAHAAVSVSLVHAKSTATFISNLLNNKTSGGGGGAVGDCVQNMVDTVDRLSRSMKELEEMGGEDMAWHVSNVETWVSAALTDETTCCDGLAGKGKGWVVGVEISAIIRRRVRWCARVTSNALALVNRFAQTTTTTTTNVVHVQLHHP